MARRSAAASCRSSGGADIPPSAALEVPAPVTRDGERSGSRSRRRSAFALENNPGIAARRLEPTRVGEAVLGAQAQFDPSPAAPAQYTQRGRPTRARSPGRARPGRRSLRQLPPREAVAHRHAPLGRLPERAPRQQRALHPAPPAVHPEVDFSVVQPLLRDFGWDFSYLVVRVAERTADAARVQYEADLADFVEQVIVAYWAVVGTRENVEVRRRAEALADRTVDENEARVRVGLLPRRGPRGAGRREEPRGAADRRLATESQLAELGFSSGKPFYTIEMPYLWGRLLSGDRIIFGAGLVHLKDWRELDSLDVAQGQPAELFARFEQRVRKFHPVLRDVQFTHRWGGPILVDADWDMRPIFRRHPESPRALVLGAYSGHGVALSVYLGRWAAEALLGRRDLPAWDGASREAQATWRRM